MSKIIKALLLTLAVTCGAVSIFFIFNIIGNRDKVVESFNAMNSVESQGADVTRQNFLKVYATYGDELFIALGVKKTDYAPGGVGDSDPGTPGEEVVKYCTCTDKCTSSTDFDSSCVICNSDWNQCAYIPPCNCTGPDPCISTNVNSNCEACTEDIKYCIVDGGSTGTTNRYTRKRASNGLYYVPQTSELWGSVMNNGTAWSSNCCAVIALYSAARNCGYTTEDMGSMVARLNPGTVSIRSDGILTGTATSVGQGGSQWNKMLADMNMSITPINGATGLDAHPTSEGDYLVYISHSNHHERDAHNNTINAHWIYVNIDQKGNARIANPASTDGENYNNYIGSKYCIRAYKVNPR